MVLLLCSFVCVHKENRLSLAGCVGGAALLKVRMKVKVALFLIIVNAN